MATGKLLATCLAIALAGATLPAQAEPTIVHSDGALAQLKANRGVTLQWISWDYRGKLDVADDHGLIHLSGGQTSRDGKATLTIDGVVTEIEAKSFRFHGRIEYFAPGIVSYNCVRDGDLTFKITGKRKFWRMQEMTADCGTEEPDVPNTIPTYNTDYVDIYF